MFFFEVDGLLQEGFKIINNPWLKNYCIDLETGRMAAEDFTLDALFFCPHNSRFFNILC